MATRRKFSDEITKELKTPSLLSTHGYPMIRFFDHGQDWYTDRAVPGYWETDPPAPSQHPKAQNSGGHMRYFGDSE
jgi:hypothetical protein